MIRMRSQARSEGRKNAAESDHFGLAMAENIDGTQSTQQAESIIIFIVRAKMCLRALDVQIESLQSI